LFGWFEKIGAERGLHISETALLLFAAAVAIGLIGEYLKEKDERWKGTSDIFELLVIIGVVGEVLFDGLIFGFSGRLDAIRDVSVAQANSIASDAYKVGNQARENASGLDLEAKKQQQVILAQAQRIIDLEIQFGLRVPKVEEKVGSLQTEIKKSADRERPQGSDIGDLRRATRGLKRNLRRVTLIRLNDPIAGQYATNLGTALKKLKFTVSFIDLPGSRFRGVIVCENGAGDVKVGEALKRAVIVSEIKRIAAEECTQPIPPTAPQGLFSFGVPNPKPAGTLIFVGHRRLPPLPN